MSELIFNLFFFGGVNFVLRYGTILNVPREFLSRLPFFKKLFNCSLCLGWHVGFWLSLLMGEGIWPSLEWAFVSSFFCWCADFYVMSLRKWVEKA
jgi:hypothetical protein